MKPILLCVSLSLYTVVSSFGQCGLQSGPMPGYSDMLEVCVWVQTKCEEEAQMKYWEAGKPETSWMSDPVMTDKDHGYTAHLIADHVSPGKKYEYAILISGEEFHLSYPLTFRTQSLWQWRTNPADFKFVAGSCTYINEPEYDRPGMSYGGGYEIFRSITQEKPDLMVWLGDNIYLREVDWDTHTGIYHRYTHTRSLDLLQPLLAATHHYAIWDDHDYGPNDSERSYWGKDMTLQAFKDFWANPNYGANGLEGITGTFFWEDCQFFMMDDRWYRGATPNTQYWGKQQLNWLIESLRTSKASYKFICNGGQVLNDAPVYETMAVYGDERKALLDSLDKYNITGVIFLTGDRHFSELSQVTTNDGDIFYDITSSALTSTCAPHADEANHNRIAGSQQGIRNYALIEVSGPQDNRICTVTLKNGLGVNLYQYTMANASKK